VSGAGPAMQIILAGVDGSSLQAAVSTFQGDAEYVELASEVTPQEVATWVHNTFSAGQRSLLNNLDWVELVQRAKGAPRLVRWELERRLATGDLAAALGREVAGTPRGGARAAPTAKFEVVALPIARTSPPSPSRRDRPLSSAGTGLSTSWQPSSAASRTRSAALRFGAERCAERQGALRDATLSFLAKRLANPLARSATQPSRARSTWAGLRSTDRRTLLPAARRLSEIHRSGVRTMRPDWRS
jgi:hypothetical protein